MDLGLGIVTAPRQKPLLDHTIKSLRHGGFWQNLHVFAEPDSVIGEHQNVFVHRNPRRLRMVQNYAQGLQWLLKNTSHCWLGMLEDDIECRSGAYAAANAVAASCTIPIGYISLYTPQAYVVYPPIKNGTGWVKYNPGWYAVGSQFYIMPRESIKWLLRDCDLIKETLYGMADAIVSDFFKRKNLDCYTHVPSWVDHIGLDLSSINNIVCPENRGLGFVSDYE